MALVVNPTYSTSNSFTTPESLIISDSTGTYNVTTNPGGFGTPNPDRVDFGMVLLVEKKGYGNTVDAEIAYDNSGNTLTTIAEWTVPITVDGWFLATVLTIPEWLIGETYDIDQAVTYNDVVYTSVAGSNIGNTPGGAEWTAASDATLILIRDDVGTYSTSHTIYLGILNIIVTQLGDIGYGNAVANDTAKGCDPECYDDINATNNIWAYLEGAKISGARSKYMEGERKVLIYTDLIAGKDCKNC